MMTTFSPSWYVVALLRSLPVGQLDTLADTDATWGRMVYRDALPLKLAGSGKRAITVTNTPGSMGGFSTRAYSNNVSCRCYADHTRTEAGTSPTEDGIDRAWAMFGKIDKVLYSPTPLSRADPFVQSERSSLPFESFDTDQNLPYVAVNYDIAVLVST